VLGCVTFPPAGGSFFVENWGVEGPAVGGFLSWEEGDEFAIEPNYAVGVVVSMRVLAVS
jgi:hypothetical protein